MVGFSIMDKYCSVLYSFLNIQKKDSLEDILCRQNSKYLSFILFTICFVS